MSLTPNNFALIIGAMKAGTTSLFYYLSEHPQIAACREKEPYFFAKEDTFNRGMNWYQSLWDWKPEHQIAIEASTTYTMQPKYLNVPERIAKIKGAEFRFIYIIRNPFSRIESHIRHLLARGLLDKVEIIEEHLAFSEYAKQLDVYANIFGRDRIYLLLLEDLQKDPVTELRKICNFLQVTSDYEFKTIDIVRNSKNSTNLHPMLRKIYNIPVVKSVATKVPPTIRQKLYKPLSRKNPYEFKLSSQDKMLIIQRLQPDLIRLKTEYNIDVKAKWGLPSAR